MDGSPYADCCRSVETVIERLYKVRGINVKTTHDWIWRRKWFKMSAIDVCNTLRCIAELGGSSTLMLADGEGNTIAHAAADTGNADALRLLAELGCGKLFCSKNARGQTPAHRASLTGSADCLRVMCQSIVATVEPLLAQLSNFGGSRINAAMSQLKEEQSLAMASAKIKGLGFDELLAEYRCEAPVLARLSVGAAHETLKTPARFAFEQLCSLALKRMELGFRLSRQNKAGERVFITQRWPEMQKGLLACLAYFTKIGGDAEIQRIRSVICTGPRWQSLLNERLNGLYIGFTMAPFLLDLATKERWLKGQLDAAIDDPEDMSDDDGENDLAVVAVRGNVLHGLCAQLGVHETTGAVDTAASARPLRVQFLGENGSGDGIRREWFATATAEMLSLDRGLFLTKDAGRTLQPNPHSATAAGPDHLSYFALLGRIAGMALFHREHLEAPWSSAFVKAMFGFDIDVDDFQARKRHFLSHLYIKINILPRQARDKHRENSKKCRFLAER